VEFTETGRRIRAARSYAGFQGRKDFSEAIEMSEATLVRLERGDRLIKRRELREIAETCGVPMWFLEGGWDGWAGEVKEAAQQIAPKAKDPMQVAEEAVALVRGPAPPSRQRRAES
jgi:transcriptional regulator with XRE-family HTH domain